MVAHIDHTYFLIYSFTRLNYLDVEALVQSEKLNNGTRVSVTAFLTALNLTRELEQAGRNGEIKTAYINARTPNATGIIQGEIPGHDGDLFLVAHIDSEELEIRFNGSKAVYFSCELQRS